MRTVLTTGIIVAALLGAFVPAALAQDQGKDPRIVDIIAAMKAQMEASKTSEMEMVMHLEIPGQQLPPFLANGITTNIWRDGDKMRVEIPHMNMVMVMTGTEMFMYQGMIDTGLHVDAGALEKIMSEQAQVLKQFGLSDNPDEALVGLLEKGIVTIAGDQVIDGVDCWLLDISPESMAAMMAAGAGMDMFANMGGMGQGQVSFHEMVMIVEKDTAKPKRMRMRVTIEVAPEVQMEMKMDMAFSKVEYGVAVPAELFAFEMPDGATVVEWTEGKTAEEVMQEYQAAAIQGAQQQQQQ